MEVAGTAGTKVVDMVVTVAGMVDLVDLEATAVDMAAATAAGTVIMVAGTVATDADMAAMAAGMATMGAGVAWVRTVAIAASARAVFNTIHRRSAKRVAFRTALRSKQCRSKVVFPRYRVWS